MNLHHLEHFLALVETGSFSRASEVLYLTQPALSRSIQMLEQELGTRLIDRVGKRNELTPFGTVVAEKARKIVSEAVDLKHTAQLLTQGDGGTIRLGLGSAPNAMFAGPLLSYMLRQYPRVGVHLSTGSPEAQVAALRERTFDALLVHSRAVPPREDLHTRLLGRVQSGFMCRRGHPLSNRHGVEFAEIVKYPVVSTVLSDETSRVLIERFGPIAHPTRFLRASSDSVAALIDAVLTTDAVFLGVLATARTWLRSGDIEVVQLDLPFEVDAQYAFVTLEGRTESPMLDVIRQFCVNLALSEVKQKAFAPDAK
ncbi:LysR family transcriptional regulator [Glaciimonas sp. PCH181]|uniref:LysR family transcriptional regulator n=1 Tax=Glaciimonas sp. PCH181 TaxID=2133943 RepID=UPI000D3653B2|nr:LysR family transcriptional regulator [Glaciimonas sp. PCH181]PUA19337.1 LysR family transcriptional regulator [Glaciimonas sp. PCH181]